METISELASRWVVRADAAPLAPADQRALDLWLNADPRHRGAYVRARAQWGDLDRLATLQGPASVAIPTAPSIAGISRRQLLAASAAAITMLGGGVSWWVLAGHGVRYTSDIGEVRRITLKDGSTVLLNTASEVVVSLSKAQRNIQLSRGEAIFEVAHDTSRPFIVQVGDSTVRAVGTAFAVRLEPRQIDVTVTEGIVEVADPGAHDQDIPSQSRTRVIANQRAVLIRGRAPNIQPMSGAAADRLLAWRDGMVSFDGESLQTAVAEINRHNRRQIVVEEATLAAKPIVGTFRSSDVDAFCAAAATVLNARTTQEGEIIRLVPAATTATR